MRHPGRARKGLQRRVCSKSAQYPPEIRGTPFASRWARTAECARNARQTSIFGAQYMFRAIGLFVLAGAVVLGEATPAFAQRQSPAFGVSRVTPPQTINFTFGVFVPKGEEGRVT